MKISKSIINLKPYQAGKSINELKREIGIDKIVKLASNENPIGVSKKVLTAIVKNIEQINRYPDSNMFDLKQSLSKKLKIKQQNLVIGNGSNELLELVAKIFISSDKDEIIFSKYAFAVYGLIAKILNAKEKIAKDKNYSHDLEAILKSISKNSKLIFIANPNNPTGTMLTSAKIYDFLKKVPEHIIVVLDQAYIEYLQEEDKSIHWISEFKNLVITRTFSKAYGLAGLRVGYLISNSKICDYINRIRAPFNVNIIAQIAAISALEDDNYLKKSIKNNKDGMKQLELAFADMNISYIPSFANFIAFKIDNATEVFNKLLKKGLIVRLIEIEDYIRVSIGTKEENQFFIDELKKILK